MSVQDALSLHDHLLRLLFLACLTMLDLQKFVDCFKEGNIADLAFKIQQK